MDKFIAVAVAIAIGALIFIFLAGGDGSMNSVQKVKDTTVIEKLVDSF